MKTGPQAQREYMNCAERFYQLARQSRSPEQRTGLLKMAQIWLILAKKAAEVRGQSGEKG